MTELGGQGNEWFEDVDKVRKISWDVNAEPEYSTLRKNEANESAHRIEENRSELSIKLDKIGKEIETITDILINKDNDSSKDLLQWNRTRKGSYRRESVDESKLRKRKRSLSITSQGRSRSLEEDLKKRSLSFNELKRIFQEQSIKQIILETLPKREPDNEAKFKSETKNSPQRTQTQTETEPSQSKAGGNLKGKSSVDKTGKNNNNMGSGRRRNKHKVSKHYKKTNFIS